MKDIDRLIKQREGFGKLIDKLKADREKRSRFTLLESFIDELKQGEKKCTK